MDRITIAPKDFVFDQSTISKRWLLLTAGEFKPGKFNSMTISWGSVGEIWNKTFFQIVVRPQRYTRSFLDSGDYFTLCVFPEARKPALSLLGAKSGRDGDKIKESGLTPIASAIAPAPGYEEAELIVECKKMYWQDIDPAHFLDPGIMVNYPKQDFHRAYFGEVVNISGIAKYSREGDGARS
ncbi:MAG TPA: flavin reductase family protein [Rectinemataceae bacterium]|nr:flavin reductase family protein [Rectinemataceae bacterium]